MCAPCNKQSNKQSNKQGNSGNNKWLNNNDKRTSSLAVGVPTSDFQALCTVCVRKVCHTELGRQFAVLCVCKRCAVCVCKRCVLYCMCAKGVPHSAGTSVRSS
jgi:hypothetical protein